MMVLGMVLVFVAQGIQALQTVIEEHLLQGIEAPRTWWWAWRACGASC